VFIVLLYSQSLLDVVIVKKKLTISLMICFLTIAFCLLSGCTSTEGEQTSLMQASMIKAVPKTEDVSPTVVPTEEVPVQSVYAEEETYVGTVVNFYECTYANKTTYCVFFEDGREMKFQKMRDYKRGGYPDYKLTKTPIVIMEENICSGCVAPGGTYKMHLTKLAEGFWLIDDIRDA